MKKYLYLFSLVLVVGFVVAYLFWPHSTDSNPYMKIGNKKYTVEYADTDESRIRGLSYRENLAQDTVLLFVFSQEGQWGIWMKDMNFPIDIMWLDRDYKVVHIQENAAPESYPDVFQTEVPALYVIEANAGFVSQNGVKIGTVLMPEGRQ